MREKDRDRDRDLAGGRSEGEKGDEKGRAKALFLKKFRCEIKVSHALCVILSFFLSQNKILEV